VKSGFLCGALLMMSCNWQNWITAVFCRY